MFIPPMLCTTLRVPGLLDDPRYAAEPKLDGQRAQVHVAGGRTIAAFSRPGRSLLAHPGLAWLRTVQWPVTQAVLDGELCAASGMEGILAIFEARQQRDVPMAFVAFDLLQVDGRDLLAKPWTARRQRLEDLGTGVTTSPITVVPVTDDAAALWATWVGWGGEGIVLKDRRAPYRPGVRSPAWLRVKRRVVLAVRVEAAERDLVRWGDWGWAARLTLTYQHPQTGQQVRIDEVVRMPSHEPFALRADAAADILCWGFLPNGRLRHPVWLGWASDRVPARR